MSKVKLNMPENDTDKPMEVTEHLSELRFRLLFVLSLLIISTCILFFYSEDILDFLTKPFYENPELKKLNIFNVTEGFSLRLKSSIIVSVLMVFPIIVLQLWAYIKPAIERPGRKFIRINIFFGILLFYSGCAFAFMMLLPFTVKMLISFIPQKMQSTINASNYMNFIFLMSVGMGVIFELPVAINILTGFGIVTPEFLSKKRKYAIVAIWIIAAVITPADILSQIAVAIPLMFLYEVAILFSFITYRGYKKKISV